MSNNKITTQGYFVKRLRDYGYYVCRVFDKYSVNDKRKWTLIINPGKESLFVTCYKTSEFSNSATYEISDGGTALPKNLFINTDSIEVVTKYLEQFDIEKIGNKSADNV